MVALIVNNSALELEPSTRVPLNLQVSDANNIGEILVSFTNSFKVPATDTNRAILDDAGRMSSNSRVPYTIINCALLLSGRDLFGRSRLVILSFDEEDGYRVAFYAGDTQLSLAGNLRDLDLSAYNFVLSTANAALYAPATEGVLYAPVNCGVDYFQNDVDLLYSQFQFYIYTLLDEIFKKAAIPIKIKNQGSTFFQRLVLPIAGPKKIASEGSNYSFSAIRSGTDQTGLLSNDTNVNLIFNSVVSGNVGGGYNIATGILTIPSASRVSIRAYIKFSATEGNNDFRTFHIRINGTSIKSSSKEYTIGTHEVNIAVDNFIATGAPVTINITYNSNHSGGNTDAMITGSTFDVEVSNDTIPGNTIDVAASLPDLTQAELFTQVMQMSNSIAYLQYGELFIMGFDRLSSSESIDLSGRLDLSRAPVVDFQPDLGRYTNFRYDNDDYSPSPTAGDASVTIRNDALKPTVEYLKLAFAGAGDVTVAGLPSMLNPVWSETRADGSGTCGRSGGAGSVKVVFTSAHKLKVTDYFYVDLTGETYYVLTVPTTTTVTVLTTGLPNFTASPWERITFKRNNLTPRVGFASEALVTQPFNFRFVTTVSPVNSYRTVLFTGGGVEGLGWSKLLKNYFPLWLGALESYKFVRAYFHLNDDDVYNADFTRTYYVDYFGSRFYVQRINKYVDPGESVELEMLALDRLIDPSQIKPL